MSAPSSGFSASTSASRQPVERAAQDRPGAGRRVRLRTAPRYRRAALWPMVMIPRVWAWRIDYRTPSSRSRAAVSPLQLPAPPCPNHPRPAPRRRRRREARSPAWVSRASSGAAVGGADAVERSSRPGSSRSRRCPATRARRQAPARIFSGRSARGPARLLQDVDLADEVGDEARARALVDLGRARRPARPGHGSSRRCGRSWPAPLPGRE